MIFRNIMRESRDTVTSIFSKEFLSLAMSMIVQSFFHILTAKKREIWYYSRRLLHVWSSSVLKGTREPKLTLSKKWTWQTCRFNRFTFRHLFLLTTQLEYCGTGVRVAIFLQRIRISSATNLIHYFHQLLIFLAHHRRLENEFLKKKSMSIQLSRHLLNHYASLRVLNQILMSPHRKQ